MSDELNYKHFTDKLAKLKVVNETKVKVLELEFYLKNKLKELLNCPQWTLSTFFPFMAELHFVNDLVKGQYIDSQYLDNINRHDNQLLRRTSILFCDVDEIRGRYVDYCQEKFNLFRKIAKEKGINDANLIEPIRLLELVEGEPRFRVEKTVGGKPSGSMLLVLPEVSKEIRCKHHKLDSKLVDQGISCKTFKTYNIKQMIELFSRYHKRIISEDDVIRDCVSLYPFGVYLKSEKYHVNDAATKYIPTIAAIERDVNSGYINRQFEHPYEGLVRLVKDSEHPWLKRSVLKHFLCGGTIKMLHPIKRERLPENHPDKYLPPFILLEPSFSEYVLGEFKVIEVFADQTEVEITLNDLVFVKDEVDVFLQIEKEKVETKEQTIIFNSYSVSVYQNISITNVVLSESPLKAENLREKDEIILNDENLKNFETGKKVRKKLKEFSQDAGEAKKEEAERYWQPLLDAAYKKVLENKSKKWSASALSETICKNHPGYKANTFRRKIGSDGRIKPYLIGK